MRLCAAAGNTGTEFDSLPVERGDRLLHALGAARVGLGQVAAEFKKEVETYPDRIKGIELFGA